MKEKSDKSKSTRLSRKYVMTELNFFHVQFEVPRINSRQLFSKKTQFLHLLWAFCQDLELQVALTGRKSLFWVKKTFYKLSVSVFFSMWEKLGGRGLVSLVHPQLNVTKT